jgi:hypothetical protein
VVAKFSRRAFGDQLDAFVRELAAGSKRGA